MVVCTNLYYAIIEILTYVHIIWHKLLSDLAVKLSVGVAIDCKNMQSYPIELKSTFSIDFNLKSQSNIKGEYLFETLILDGLI